MPALTGEDSSPFDSTRNGMVGMNSHSLTITDITSTIRTEAITVVEIGA